MNICTIVAKNYIAYARVLARSFARHHPDGRCWVLVIDDHEGWIDPAAEPFELVTIPQLEIESFDRMAALYSVLELSTAVKPWLLRHLMDEQGAERLVYLDPDIEVHDSLQQVDDLLGEYEVVVTPHLTEPMPRDGKRPAETDILIAGSYNLGFVGLRRDEQTDRLIDWWSERLVRDCIVAPERGYFVDQRWMDFAPGLVQRFFVLRDPGYNVAYWNLAGRRVKRAGDGYEVNGRPLRFFHFSGYDPRAPHELSKHQSRISLADEPIVRAICDRYGEALVENGFLESVEWPYTYSRLPNGLELTGSVRQMYRQAELAGELDGSLFEPAGAERFVAWLNEPAEVGAHAGVTRYLAGLRASRGDLKAAFPDLAGADAERYVSWARIFGTAEQAIPRELVPNGAWHGRAARRSVAQLGVNVAGYFHSVLGVGEAARQVVRALETQDVDVQTIGLVAQHSEQSEDFESRGDPETAHAINLVCVNADVTEQFAFDIGEGFFHDRYSIGLWWWEVNRFPERWFGAFRHLDEVWVGSHHVAEAIAAVAPVPVVRIPVPVTAPTPAPLGRGELGLPDDYLFLFTFDYESVFERKNPLAAVEAFTRAFEPGAGAALALKCINHEHHPEEHRRLLEAAAARDDVIVLDRYMERAEKDAVTAACDAYVSLHRSEGFGFTLAEAMALGKPVVATAYSGNLDYMTAANSYLVDYELVDVGEGAEPYPADAQWAEPDLDHAASLMRHVFEDREEALARGARGREDLDRDHSLDAAGRALAERLAHATARGLRAARRTTVAPIADTSVVAERIRSGPSDDWAPGGRFGRARLALRHAILRVLKVYTVHQRAVDAELVQAIRALDAGLQSLAVDTAERGRAAAEVERLVDQTLAPLPDRLDDLASQVDLLRAQADESSRFIASFGMTGGGIQKRAAVPASLPEAPVEPWTPEYAERHRDFVSAVLDDPSLLMVFKAEGNLPDGYGVGFDERVVEFPWIFTREVHGRMLDAGSALNHAHTLARLRPRVRELHVVTLAPEPQAYPYLDVSYLYADLRELPLRDETYDVVASISTLEHVGMDNSQYGAPGASPDPDGDLAQATRELWRVLKPGGRLYVTVPYGERADHSWLRVFDSAALDSLIDAFGPAEPEEVVFAYDAGGWRFSSRDEAKSLRYRDPFSGEEPGDDRAAAARAVACVELRKPA